jgi:hypothetical protein
MSDEFDKLKDAAEKQAQEHPQQVKEGEQAIEKDLGVQPQDQSRGQTQQGEGQEGQSGTSGQDQDQDQHSGSGGPGN